MKPPILTTPLPDFKGTSLDVISYSLFVYRPGQHKKGSKPPSAYVGGMIENARLAPRFYPGWVVHCYLSDELPQVKKPLEDLGVVVTMYRNFPFWQGLFTRLLVMADPRIRRFCLRDTDSRLGSKDQAAVEEWIKSGHKWHSMRDHPCHGVPLLGCAWGGPGMSFPNVKEEIAKWMVKDFKKGSDQRFLAAKVWPAARKDCLQHDSQFGSRFGETKPFPKPIEPYPYRYLFQTWKPEKDSWRGLVQAGEGIKGDYSWLTSGDADE